MLILTRRIGESIKIGENVTIKVVGCRKGQIKIGIDAPRELPVHRQEIYEKIQVRSAESDEKPTHDT